MNRLIVGCVISLFVLFSEEGAKYMSVAQYGALPNDGNDDAASLRQALRSKSQRDVGYYSSQLQKYGFSFPSWKMSQSYT